MTTTTATVHAVIGAHKLPVSWRIVYATGSGSARLTKSFTLNPGLGQVQVQLTLKHLKKASRYAVKVRVTNRFGSSNSRARRFVTAKAQPKLAPRPGGTGKPVGTPAAAGRRMLWGAQIGNQFTGGVPPYDMTSVMDFSKQDAGGKGMSVVPFNLPWKQCTDTTYSSCTDFAFPTSGMNTIRSYGAIPMLNWSSTAIPLPTDQKTEPNFSLTNIISGTYDSYITQFAQAAAAWGHPFFLRFDWEMNGNWYPWSQGANGNNASQVVTAWQHVHNIFASVGATNAQWVWCPFVYSGNSSLSLSQVYPGSSYVDWTCLDGYNWGTATHGPSGFQTFDQIFKQSYQQITQTIAPGKPMMLGEVATSAAGGDKAGWITNMFSDVANNYPGIDGLIYYDEADSHSNGDWALEGNSGYQSAFAAGVGSSAYAADSYGAATNSSLSPTSGFSPTG